MKCAFAAAMFTVVCALSGMGPVEPPAPALNRFTPQDQERIKQAAPDFRLADSGVFWDRQVEREKASAKKRPAAEERAYGWGPKPCDSVPLWYDAISGLKLTRPGVVAAVESVTVVSPGCNESKDRFVCERVVDSSTAIVERWADNSAAEKRWLAKYGGAPLTRPGEPAPKTKSVPPPPFVQTGERLILIGWTFEASGEKVSKLHIRRLEERRVGSDQLLAYEVCKGPEKKPAVQPVTGEQLAEAVLNGKAKLTSWRWARTTQDVIEWVPKDVTPKPVAESAPVKP